MKKIMALTLVLLLLLTACGTDGGSKTNDDGTLLLPTDKISWATTLEEAQKTFPDGKLSTTGDNPAEEHVRYTVTGELGKVWGETVTSIELTFRPALPYKGTENASVLSNVSFTLDTDKYSDLGKKIDEQLGTHENKTSVTGTMAPYSLWTASKGLRDLDAKTAALALALQVSPVGLEEVNKMMMGATPGVPKDAAEWPGLNLDDEAACKALIEKVPADLQSRTLTLTSHAKLVLDYSAGPMKYVPLAESLLNGK